MPIHTTDALVLRTIEYSETSLVVWLYTREHGRVHVIAKGARRARSAFEGALEPLVQGELVFYRKAKSNGALDIAKEFDPTHLHRGLRTELDRLYRGVYLAELVSEISEPDAPCEQAWAAVVGGLEALARGPKTELDLALFRAELQLIDSAGLSPCLSGCAICGHAEAHQFSVPAGGLLCVEHAKRDPKAKSVPVGAVKTLAAIAQGAQVRCGREVAGAIRGLLDDFTSHHLGKQLRTQRYLSESYAARPVRRARPAPRAASARAPQGRGPGPSSPSRGPQGRGLPNRGPSARESATPDPGPRGPSHRGPTHESPHGSPLSRGPSRDSVHPPEGRPSQPGGTPCRT